MRASLLICVVLVGCSGASGVDAGAGDAGSFDSGVSVTSDAGADAGCFGVPERLALTSCDSQLLLGCPATADQLRAQRDGVCQPASAYGGGVATLSCGAREVVAYTTFAASEAEAITVECFYELGGALSGVLRFAGSTVSGFGTVADCNRTAPVPCDEQCFGVPSPTSTRCVSQPGACAATAEAMRLSATSCDPQTDFGALATEACAGFEVVIVRSAPFGERLSCFYEPDGGSVAGSLRDTDTGTIAWGHVAACGVLTPLECDGQCEAFPQGVQATCVPLSRFGNCVRNIRDVVCPPNGISGPEAWARAAR